MKMSKKPIRRHHNGRDLHNTFRTYHSHKHSHRLYQILIKQTRLSSTLIQALSIQHISNPCKKQQQILNLTVYTSPLSLCSTCRSDCSIRFPTRARGRDVRSKGFLCLFRRVKVLSNQDQKVFFLLALGGTVLCVSSDTEQIGC